jgi:hypothetical protein
MDQITPKQPLIIIIWTHQEMIARMSRKSIGILDVLMQDFGSEVGKTGQILLHCRNRKSNPASDLHGPDDAQTTIDHHHLDPSRDNGMDEQEIHWYFGCLDAGFWLKVGQTGLSLLHCQSQIQHSMTSMDQMMPKQHLIIIIWTHQVMMAWMSSKSIGILDVLMQDFGSEVSKTGQILLHCHQSPIQHSMTSMGQMMPKQPLIIIIWTHQETMAWMSRKSIGILDVFMGDFGSKLGKLG